jgi:hypothetical protein
VKIALALALAALGWAQAPPVAAARAASNVAAGASPRRASSTAPSKTPRTVPSKAPSAGSLDVGADSALGGVSAAAEASASAPTSGGEPLAGNGLSSPLCRDADAADLPASAARDCRTAGFEAAPAPSGDYAFDVHVNTGLTRVGNDAAAWTQDLMQFGWTSQVAAVHGLIVLLDWCFTLDLLDSPAMSGVARELRATQATFTQPWLAVMLAIAAVLALYHGLIRRRVAETLGEVALMLAMMAGGLWVIMNPTGTIGALGAWTNEASLGTLGAVMAGTPAHPARTLAESSQFVFSTAITGPWCYLEFDDVSWCENTARLDPRLHAAALRIAGEGGSRAPGQSAALLRAARTNGELFLALPANGAARNSINEAGTLFNVLCGGSEEPCTGPTASQAEARTQSGTGARVIGMAFISFGLLGMMLTLGFIALRLLRAAIVSLICLLLTPAAVLAPTLGESGRAAFRTWATRLLGAVTSKLVFSFLLGAVLETERAMSSVRVGWLTQWVLLSAMWWIGFANRHKVFDFAHGERNVRHPSLARRVNTMLETPRTAFGMARSMQQALSREPPSVEQRDKREQAGRERAQTIADEQVGRSLDHDLMAAREQVAASPLTQARLAGMREQLQRVRTQRTLASTDGNTRRAAELGTRERRIEGEIAHAEGSLPQARQTAAAAEDTRRRTGKSHTHDQHKQRARWLDEQAALPAAGRADAAGRRRDYPALAGLAGHSRERYEQLDGHGKRSARAEVDRELALRKELGGAVADVVATDAAGALGRGEKRKAAVDLDRAVDERLRSRGQRPPSRRGGGSRGGDGLRAGGSRIESWKREGSARADAHARKSTVMDDAREVAARRKRQLGRDRR